MQNSYKRCRNFSKLLYNINFAKTHFISNDKTFDRNSSFKKENSSSNLIQPEIEYVTKLNFFIPKSPNLEKREKTNSSVENRIFENKLENRRKELENKIINIKENLKPLNEELTKILSEIDNLKLDYEILQNNKTCSIIEKNIKKNLIINNMITPKELKNDSLPFLLNKNNIEEKYKIETILSKHKKDMKSKKNFALMKSAQLKEQKKEIIKKIKSYENDLKLFREEKNKIKNELLSHYHNILHEGKDIRKTGLSWVILAIWNLNSEVLPSYLPQFLDEESISFLFDYSTKKLKLKEMNKTIQKIVIKINEEKNKNLNNLDTIELEKDYYNLFEENKDNNNNKWLVNTVMNKFNKKINFNSNFNTPKDRLSDYFTYRNNSLNKKEKEIDNNKENDTNNNTIRNNSSFSKLFFKTGDDIKNYKTNQNSYELYNKKKIYEKKIYKLKKEIQNLIDNELQRLNNNFYKGENENKYDSDKNKIIYAVIGEDNARDEINKQISESKKYFTILKQIKKTKIDN